MPSPILVDSIAVMYQGEEPWPSDVKLYQPYEIEQILLPDNANCLAVQAYLRMCGLAYEVVSKSNAEFMSPSGNVPFIKCGKYVISEFEQIVSFVENKGISLTSKLDDSQKSDMKAYMSLINFVLGNSELYVCWVDDVTYNSVTKPRYSSIFPWPLNVLQARSKRAAVHKYLKGVTFYTKTPEEVYQEVETCCRSLSDRLDNKEYFFGSKPSELDALLFGHLTCMNKIGASYLMTIYNQFTNLRTYQQNIHDKYFFNFNQLCGELMMMQDNYFCVTTPIVMAFTVENDKKNKKPVKSLNKEEWKREMENFIDFSENKIMEPKKSSSENIKIPSIDSSLPSISVVKRKGDIDLRADPHTFAPVVRSKTSITKSSRFLFSQKLDDGFTTSKSIQTEIHNIKYPLIQSHDDLNDSMDILIQILQSLRPLINPKRLSNAVAQTNNQIKPSSIINAEENDLSKLAFESRKHKFKDRQESLENIVASFRPLVESRSKVSLISHGVQIGSDLRLVTKAEAIQTVNESLVDNFTQTGIDNQLKITIPFQLGRIGKLFKDEMRPVRSAISEIMHKFRNTTDSIDEDLSTFKTHGEPPPRTVYGVASLSHTISIANITLDLNEKELFVLDYKSKHSVPTEPIVDIGKSDMNFPKYMKLVHPELYEIHIKNLSETHTYKDMVSVNGKIKFQQNGMILNVCVDFNDYEFIDFEFELNSDQFKNGHIYSMDEFQIDGIATKGKFYEKLKSNETVCSSKNITKMKKDETLQVLGKPTELDALLFGHLFTVITTPLPESQFASIVRQYPSLVEHAQRIENEYFQRT